MTTGKKKIVSLQKMEAMTYQELLLKKEWEEKCCDIIGRDLYTCQDCGMIGFHKNTYLKLTHLEELDNLLKNLRLNNRTISSFIKERLFTFEEQVNDIPFSKLELDTPSLFYKISLLGKGYFNFLTVPAGLKVVCDYEQKNANAKMYEAENVTSVSNNELKGNLLLLEFDNKLSDNTYVNIEYHIKGYCNYIPIEDTLINVTSGNYFFSIRMNPFDSGLKCLNIHHKYYIKGKKPWDYPNTALITLCQDCHHKRHSESTIPFYNDDNNLLDKLKPCPRCGGRGYLPRFHYYMGGICFECGGEGVVI